MSTQKNGVSNPKQNGKHTANTTTTLTVVKDQKPVPTVPGKEISALPPLEDRLHRLNQLFDLQQKYNQLQSSLIKLKNFELGKDEDSCRITFSDKNRNEFTTTNQFLMPKFLAFVKSEIQARIKEIEPLLKW